MEILRHPQVGVTVDTHTPVDPEFGRHATDRIPDLLCDEERGGA